MSDDPIIGSVWLMIPPRDIEDLGYIPSFLDLNDPRPAKEQIDERYKHGGGWRKSGDNWSYDQEESNAPLIAQYPEGDEIYRPWGLTYLPLSDEMVIVFDCAFTMILKENGSFEVARLD